MNGCVHLPTTLADAQAILACYGGADWRSLFLMGLGALLVVGLLMIVVVLAWKGRA